jgi:hypothetical protein
LQKFSSLTDLGVFLLWLVGLDPEEGLLWLERNLQYRLDLVGSPLQLLRREYV